MYVIALSCNSSQLSIWAHKCHFRLFAKCLWRNNGWHCLLSFLYWRCLLDSCSIVSPRQYLNFPQIFRLRAIVGILKIKTFLLLSWYVVVYSNFKSDWSCQVNCQRLLLVSYQNQSVIRQWIGNFDLLFSLIWFVFILFFAYTFYKLNWNPWGKFKHCF